MLFCERFQLFLEIIFMNIFMNLGINSQIEKKNFRIQILYENFFEIVWCSESIIMHKL